MQYKMKLILRYGGFSSVCAFVNSVCYSVVNNTVPVWSFIFAHLKSGSATVPYMADVLSREAITNSRNYNVL